MYINQITAYIPETVIDNEHFQKLIGLSEEWLLNRTGIRERRKASQDENTNTLVTKALAQGLTTPPFPTESIDLIVGGTYTPYDTIHTLAHAAQNFLEVSDIPVVSISSACSSFANAMEIVQGYFAMGKSKRAIVVLADHNTAYSDETDKVGGHLWGDGACALWISQERLSENDWEVKDIITGGAGNIGKASDSVFLRPAHEGFMMQNGRDVFQNACQYMSKVTQDILKKNGYTLEDLSYFVPHQANLRITKNVAQSLNLPEEKALSNIQYLGNTGCAGCCIALWENQTKFKPGDLIAVTVFGGGYSYGSVLLVC
jgi:3-oxoacyl-[acyl-carrier-protein] synthase-3